MHHLPNDILHLLFSRLEFPSILSIWLCGDSRICLEIEKWTRECRLVWHGLGPLYGDSYPLLQKGNDQSIHLRNDDAINKSTGDSSSRLGKRTRGPLFWPQLLSHLPNLTLLNVRHASEIRWLPVKATERIRLPRTATDVSLSFLGVHWVISDAFDFTLRLPHLYSLHLSQYSTITDDLLRNMPVQLQKLEIKAGTSSLSSSWPLLLAPSLMHLSLAAMDKSLSTIVAHPWMSSLQSLRLNGYVSVGLFDHLAPTCAFSSSFTLPLIAPRNHSYSFLPIGTTDFGVEPQIELPDLQVTFPPSLTSLTIHCNKRILFNDLANMLPTLTSLVVCSDALTNLEFATNILPASLRTFKCQSSLFPVFEPSLFLLLPHLEVVEMSNERTHFGMIQTLSTGISRLHIHLESCYGHDELPRYDNLETLICEGGDLLMTFEQVQSILATRPTAPQDASTSRDSPISAEIPVPSAEMPLIGSSRLTSLSIALPLLPCVTRLLPPTLTSLSVINRHNPRRERVKMILNEWETTSNLDSDSALHDEANTDLSAWHVKDILPPCLTYLRIEEGLLKPALSRRISDHLWRPSSSHHLAKESILTNMPLETLIITSESEEGELPSWILANLPKTLKRAHLRIKLPMPRKTLNTDLSSLPRGLRQLIVATSTHYEGGGFYHLLDESSFIDGSEISDIKESETTMVRLEEATWRRMPSSLLLLSLPCFKPPPSRIPLLPPLLLNPYNYQYYFLDDNV